MATEGEPGRRGGFWTSVGGILTAVAALVTAVGGIITIVRAGDGSDSPNPPSSPSAIVESVSPTEGQSSEPVPTVTLEPVAAPQGTCPSVHGMFWMQFPESWYGPFGGYFLGWHQAGGFSVWDPVAGGIEYPDPGGQVQRNTWFELSGTPFTICVDTTMGNVLARFQG